MLRIWDATTQRRLCEIKLKKAITTMAYVPNGKGLICSTTGGKLEVRDPKTGVLLREVGGNDLTHARSPAYMANGKVIVVGDGTAVKRLHGESWGPEPEPKIPLGPTETIDF
jgi:hypothetical protein